MQKTMLVNQTEYKLLKLLGHGKGGYSYLAEKDGVQYVLKEIHHEPCSYYTFGNKIEAERSAYQKLSLTNIRIHRMLDIDMEAERIIKEYIDGPTICQLVETDAMEDHYYHQVREMAAMAQAAGMNIDYFPTNFVVQDGLLYYIDYECNEYMDQWNFENWGNTYWYKSREFMEYIANR